MKLFLVAPDGQTFGDTGKMSLEALFELLTAYVALEQSEEKDRIFIKIEISSLEFATLTTAQRNRETRERRERKQ